MPITDLLRLLIIPVFAWTAWEDYKTRRIPSQIWTPLLVLGVVLLLWDGYHAYTGPPLDFYRFLLAVTISIGFLVPLSYAFYWFGGFGGADAKAFIIIAVLLPTFPTYTIATYTLPLTQPDFPIFSLTIVLNAVLVGALYPLALFTRNALTGRFSWLMLVGLPVHWEAIETTHGKLLESPTGINLGGLDLDALRMYLRWRGITLGELRENPDKYRDPTSLPATPNPPTDGAITDSSLQPDGGNYEDPWGADRFLTDISHSAYGTSPTQLRTGLDVVTTQTTIWISPGIPFILPIFIGLLIAFTYGDIFFTLLGILGIA